MTKLLLKLFFTFLLLFTAYSAFCQTGTLPGSDEKTKPDDKSNDGTSSFKFGVSYLSNNVFMGRSDTATTPTIIPQIKYTLKSGIYISSSLDFIPGKKKKKLDGGDITAGYEFDITDNLSGSASYAKLFYSSTSTQIASSISSTFNGNLTYDFGDIISATISSDYNINKQGINNDVFANFGLSHDFIVAGLFGDADVFLVSPTATINTGTQNFYDAYLVKKKLKTAKLTAKQAALVTQYTNQLSKYSLLDYEISAPLEYKTGHFIFQFTPTYAVVEDQLPKTIETRISNKPSVFYFEAGVFLKF